MAIAYSVSIGSLSFANEGRDARPLLGIETEVGIGGAGGWCLIQLGDPSWGDPALGDAVSVELDVGDGKTKVFTGEVEGVERRATSLWIRSRDALAKLARTEVEAAYEEASAGFIVGDLIDQAGADKGEVDEGPTFPSYVVHRGPRALRHIQKLAELIGVETGSDGEGKVHFRKPKPAGAADHRLVWGEDLLTIQLERAAVQVDSFAVWGEGAGGSKGAERSHWLPTDLSGVTGEAKVSPGSQPGQAGTVSPGSSGPLVRTVFDGAVRSSDVAGDLAKARAELVALRPMLGHALVLGRPDIQPGDWVELADLPAGQGPASALTLRARRVIHQFAIERGLLTRLEF
ncbi:hypothetical protein ACNOYE_07720 [Nannocystaceae bacterium ST9]